MRCKIPDCSKTQLIASRLKLRQDQIRHVFLQSGHKPDQYCFHLVAPLLVPQSPREIIFIAPVVEHTVRQQFWLMIPSVFLKHLKRSYKRVFISESV